MHQPRKRRRWFGKQRRSGRDHSEDRAGSSFGPVVSPEAIDANLNPDLTFGHTHRRAPAICAARHSALLSGSHQPFGPYGERHQECRKIRYHALERARTGRQVLHEGIPLPRLVESFAKAGVRASGTSVGISVRLRSKVAAIALVKRSLSNS
jgi:hypothetical protein